KVVGRKTWYLTAITLFALGLMAKPMLVTLPFVLLLLDYWPLGRISPPLEPALSLSKGGFRGLIIEKAPFFLLAVISAVLTFIAQQKGGAVGALGDYTFMMRITNALTAYAGYLIKMIWPFKLAVFYPHHGMSPLWQVAGSIVLLSGISVFVLRNRVRMPYLAMGWLWYLITLVPVIGLVQAGLQAIADRYTYLPLIGIFIMIVWLLPEAVSKWRYSRRIIGTICILIIGMLMVITYVQVRYWKNGIFLFEHAIAVTDNNPIACYNLGLSLSKYGENGQAVVYFKKALEINPEDDLAYHNLGVIMSKEGNNAAAIDYLNRALKINPDDHKTHYNLGLILAREGKDAIAAEHYIKAIRLDPEYLEAYSNLGVILAMRGELEQAIICFKKALIIDPGYTPARDNLKKALELKTHSPKRVNRQVSVP
ncbi:MAG: tetratricopeptide repeat protein, partial [Candidatus Margulisiibacteriota bacterium]